MTNRLHVALPSMLQSIETFNPRLADPLFERVLKIVERHGTCRCGEPVLGKIIAVRATRSQRHITGDRLAAMERELASPSGSSGRSILRVNRSIISGRGGAQ